MKTLILTSAALLAVCTAPCFAQAASDAPVAAFTVDASQPGAALPVINGTNGPPIATNPRVAQHPLAKDRPVDLTAAYRNARYQVVRTHDADVGDIDSNVGTLAPVTPGMGPMPKDLHLSVIFPNANADPSDPKSYDFTDSDKLVSSIQATGAQVLFRLGRGGAGTAEVPTDLKKYGAIIRHIVLHYQKGWNNGFTNSVAYWEVWNEPDLGHIWWRGTPEQYYKLYGAAVTAVRAADPKALVGGPTIALVNENQPFREGFLSYVKANKLPLDFFSWHYYSDAHDPYDFIRLGLDIRKILDSYGFTHTQSFLDEWNDGVFGPPQTNAQRGAFFGAAMTYMQDAKVDLSGYYRGDAEFNADGTARTASGHVILAYGHFADTPLRLPTTGSDDKGLTVLAAENAGGDEINVLVTNYEVPADMRVPRTGPDEVKVPNLFTMKLPPRRALSYAGYRGYQVHVAGLVAGASYQVERHTLSPSGEWTRSFVAPVTGPSADLQGDLPAPGVEWLSFKRVKAQ